jgi:hypothetical protein
MVTTLANSPILGILLMVICVGAVIAREALRIRAHAPGRAERLLSVTAWVSAVALGLLVLARFAVISS